MKKTIFLIVMLSTAVFASEFTELLSSKSAQITVNNVTKTDWTNQELIDNEDKITHINLTANNADITLNGLENLTNLDSLYITGDGDTSSVLPLSTILSKLNNNINVLDLVNVTLDNDSNNFPTSLNSLSLQSCNLGGDIDLSNNTNLSDITLHDNNLLSVHIGDNSHLFSLNLSNNKIVNFNEDNLNSLTSLVIDNNFLESVSLNSSTDLKILNMRNNRLSDISFIHGLTNITILDLAGNNISNVENLENLGVLDILDIDYNDVTVTYSSSQKFDNRASDASVFCKKMIDNVMDFAEWTKICKTNNFAITLMATSADSDATVWVDFNNDNVVDSGEINPNLGYYDWIANKDYVKEYTINIIGNKRFPREYIDSFNFMIPTYISEKYKFNAYEGISAFANLQKITINGSNALSNYTNFINFSALSPVELDLFSSEILNLFDTDSLKNLKIAKINYMRNRYLEKANNLEYLSFHSVYNTSDFFNDFKTKFPNLKSFITYAGRPSDLNFLSDLSSLEVVEFRNYKYPYNANEVKATIRSQSSYPPDLSALSTITTLKFLNLSGIKYAFDKVFLNDMVFDKSAPTYPIEPPELNDDSKVYGNILREYPFRFGNRPSVDSNFCKDINNDVEICGEIDNFFEELANEHASVWFDLNNNDTIDSDELKTDANYTFYKDNYSYIKSINNLNSYNNIKAGTFSRGFKGLEKLTNLKSLKIKVNYLTSDLNNMDLSAFSDLEEVEIYQGEPSGTQISDLTRVSNYVKISNLNLLSTIPNLKKLKLYVGISNGVFDTSSLYRKTYNTFNINTYGLKYHYNSRKNSVQLVIALTNNIDFSFINNLSNKIKVLEIGGFKNMANTSLDFSKYQNLEELALTASYAYTRSAFNSNDFIQTITSPNIKLIHLAAMGIGHNIDFSNIPDSLQILSLPLNMANTSEDSNITNLKTTNLSSVNLSGFYSLKDISFLNNQINFGTNNGLVNFHFFPAYSGTDYTVKASDKSDFCDYVSQNEKWCEYIPMHTDNNLLQKLVDSKASITLGGVDMSSYRVEDIYDKLADITNIGYKYGSKLIVISKDDLIGINEFVNLAMMKAYVSNADFKDAPASLTYLYLKTATSPIKIKNILLPINSVTIEFTHDNNSVELSADTPSQLKGVYLTRKNTYVNNLSFDIIPNNFNNFISLRSVTYLKRVPSLPVSTESIYLDKITEDISLNTFKAYPNLKYLQTKNYYLEQGEFFQNYFPSHPFNIILYNGNVHFSSGYIATAIPFENMEKPSDFNLGNFYTKLTYETKAKADSLFCNSFTNNTEKFKYCKYPDFIHNNPFFEKLMNSGINYPNSSYRSSFWVDYNNDNIENSGETLKVENFNDAENLYNNKDLVKGVYISSKNYLSQTELNNMVFLFKNLINIDQLYLNSDVILDRMSNLDKLKTLYLQVTSNRNYDLSVLDNINLEKLTVHNYVSLGQGYAINVSNLKINELSISDKIIGLDTLNNLKKLTYTSRDNMDMSFLDNDNIEYLDLRLKHNDFNLDKINLKNLKSLYIRDTSRPINFNFLAKSKIEYLRVPINKTIDISGLANITTFGENTSALHSYFNDKKDGIMFTGANFSPLSDKTPFCLSDAVINIRTTNLDTYKKLCSAGYQYTLKSLNNSDRMLLTTNGETYQTYLDSGATDTIELNANTNLEDYYGVSGVSDLTAALLPYIHPDSRDGVEAISIDNISWGDNKNTLKINITRTQNKVETLLIKFKDLNVYNSKNIIFTEAKVLEDIYSDKELAGHNIISNFYKVKVNSNFSTNLYEKSNKTLPITLFPYVYYDKISITTDNTCVYPIKSNGKYVLEGLYGLKFHSDCDEPALVTIHGSNINSSDNIPENDYTTSFYVGPKIPIAKLLGNYKYITDKDLKINNLKLTLSNNLKILNNSLVSLSYDNTKMNISYNTDKNTILLNISLVNDKESVPLAVEVIDPDDSSIRYTKVMQIIPYSEVGIAGSIKTDDSFLMVVSSDSSLDSLISAIKKSKLKVYDVDSIKQAISIIRSDNPSFKNKTNLEIFRLIKSDKNKKEGLEKSLKTTIEKSNKKELLNKMIEEKSNINPFL